MCCFIHCASDRAPRQPLLRALWAPERRCARDALGTWIACLQGRCASCPVRRTCHISDPLFCIFQNLHHFSDPVLSYFRHFIIIFETVCHRRARSISERGRRRRYEGATRWRQEGPVAKVDVLRALCAESVMLRILVSQTVSFFVYQYSRKCHYSYTSTFFVY